MHQSVIAVGWLQNRDFRLPASGGLILTTVRKKCDQGIENFAFTETAFDTDIPGSLQIIKPVVGLSMRKLLDCCRPIHNYAVKNWNCASVRRKKIYYNTAQRLRDFAGHFQQVMFTAWDWLASMRNTKFLAWRWTMVADPVQLGRVVSASRLP